MISLRKRSQRDRNFEKDLRRSEDLPGRHLASGRLRATKRTERAPGGLADTTNAAEHVGGGAGTAIEASAVHRLRLSWPRPDDKTATGTGGADDGAD